MRNVYIVGGARTPFVKSKNTPGPFSAADLAVTAGRQLLASHHIKASWLNELVLGCVMPSPTEANIARVVALRLGCPEVTPAYTVQRNCASGLQAIDSAAKDIGQGRHDLVLAGGTEAMSRAPLLLNTHMTTWLAGLLQAKTVPEKVKCALKFRLSMLRPEVALLKGLTDPFTGLSMGQTAEELAYQFDITREAMDEYALQSHERAANTWAEGEMRYIAPLYSHTGDVYSKDDGIRPDGTLQKLAKLRPFFDKQFGAVTPGNSSQISDGAAVVLLASQAAVDQYQLPVLGRIVATEWVGVAPDVMGIGPAHAIAQLLRRTGLSVSDIHRWEINEAFAAQVLACQKAMASNDYCQLQLGLPAGLGVLPNERLNSDGGAIALGHPVGASGARIVLNLLQVLKRHQEERGIASLCVGGGQGGAMLIQRED